MTLQGYRTIRVPCGPETQSGRPLCAQLTAPTGASVVPGDLASQSDLCYGRASYMVNAQPYSLTLLLHPQASTKEQEDVETLVRGWIEQREGTVGTVTHEQKRRLAYPITHAHQATYTRVPFSLGPQDMSDLRERLQRQKKVLRFVVFQQAPREGKGLKDVPLRPVMADKAGGAAIPKKEKASLEKLDEKIGEILKEEVL